jgi:sialidase-1
MRSLLPVRSWTALAVFTAIVGPAAGSSAKDGRTVELKTIRVRLSQPILVARSKGYLWFPTVHRLSDGALLAVMSDYPDKHVQKATARGAWSHDGGQTWSAPRPALYGDVGVRLANGDELLLPYYLYPRKEGMGAACQVVPRGKETAIDRGEVLFTGWPRPDRSFDKSLGLSGFVTNGQAVPLKGGGQLATLYGYLGDDKKYTLVTAESADGVTWNYRSTVAGADCKLKGAEGPCEAALARLKDGRLLCVYRLASNVPYGYSFSGDDRKTWTEPASMPAEVFSVQPSLAVLPGGTVALSGGRPGLFLWLNSDGAARTWERIDILAHHNATVPTKEEIGRPGGTSSYTEVVSLNDRELLMIYDRIPSGWSQIPEGAKETNSVWVVRITLEKPGGKPMAGRADVSPEVQKRALDILRKGLRQTEELFPAVHAAEALTLAGHGAEVRAVFPERLKAEKDGKRRAGLARELFRAGDKDKAEVLVGLLADPAADAQVHAAESMYKVGAYADGKELRQAFAREENVPLRMMAAAALARSGDAPALAMLRKTLTGTDSMARGYAAWALGRVGNSSDIPALKEAARTETKPLERCFLDHALAHLGDPDGRTALLKNLQGKDETIRGLAAETAGYCGDNDFVKPLTALLDDPILDVRLRGSQALLMLAR